MTAFDTNVLIYSCNKADTVRQQIAARLPLVIGVEGISNPADREPREREPVQPRDRGAEQVQMIQESHEIPLASEDATAFRSPARVTLPADDDRLWGHPAAAAGGGAGEPPRHDAYRFACNGYGSAPFQQ